MDVLRNTLHELQSKYKHTHPVAKVRCAAVGFRIIVCWALCS